MGGATDWAFLDGAILPIREAKVPATDRGFLLGDGAFEVFRTYGGTPFRLGAHMERLRASLAGVGIPLPMPWGDLERGLLALVRRAGADVTVRVTVSRGSGGEGYLPPADPRGTVFAFCRPLPDVDCLRARGLAAILSRTRRMPAACLDPAWKTASGLPLVLARKEAADAGADEAILLNLEGEIAEGSHTNVFVVRDGAVRTPPLGAGILSGVTRAAVRETSGAREEVLRPDDLRRADEAFLTYTSAGPVPLVALDGAPVGTGRAGPATLEAIRRFDDLLRRECGTDGR